MKLKAKDLALVAMLAALIAICSWITVPGTVPFTMQTFAVFLAVGLLGGRRGVLAVAVYILLGAAGLPVFAGFAGGVGVLFGVTGGYIVGFLFSALVLWWVTHRFGTGRWALFCAMLAGLLVCYAFGTAWFLLVYARTTGPVGLATALGWCVLPFVLPDLLKIALALFVTRRLQKLSAVRRLLA